MNGADINHPNSSNETAYHVAKPNTELRGMIKWLSTIGGKCVITDCIGCSRQSAIDMESQSRSAVRDTRRVKFNL